MPINNLMEDAATAEIARVQLWQWVKYGSKTVRTPLFCSRTYRYLAWNEGLGGVTIGGRALFAGRDALAVNVLC